MRWRRPPPAAPVLALNDVICGRSWTFTLAPGSPLRAAGCLVCCQAAAGRPVFVFAVFGFRLPAEQCGAFSAASWVIHSAHPRVPDEELAGIAVFRHSMCLEAAL